MLEIVPIIQNQDKKTNLLFTEYIVIKNHPYNSRLQSEDMQHECRTDAFKISLFPYVIQNGANLMFVNFKI